MIRVRYGKDVKEFAFPGGTVADLLETLGINPVEVLVSRHGVVIPDDTCIFDEEEVMVTRIVHGG